MDRFIYLGNVFDPQFFDLDQLNLEIMSIENVAKHYTKKDYELDLDVPQQRELLKSKNITQLYTKNTVGYMVEKTYTARAFLQDYELFPELNKLVNYFGLEYHTTPSAVPNINVIHGVRIHAMAPGQMFPAHVDDLTPDHPGDTTKLRRIQVALTDWQFGQLSDYGGYKFEKWKAGDAFMFDWRVTPHFAVNASDQIRPILILTGLTTSRTEEIIKNGVKM